MCSLCQLAFEKERIWLDEAIRSLGLEVIASWVEPERAAEICANYADRDGETQQIILKCTPHMTKEDVAARVRELLRLEV